MNHEQFSLYRASAINFSLYKSTDTMMYSLVSFNTRKKSHLNTPDSPLSPENNHASPSTFKNFLIEKRRERKSTHLIHTFYLSAQTELLHIGATIKLLLMWIMPECHLLNSIGGKLKRGAIEIKSRERDNIHHLPVESKQIIITFGE